MDPAPTFDRRWLILLLGADLAFVALHLIYAYSPWLERSAFDIGRDRGFAEFFQYGKSTWIALAFLTLRRLRPAQGYGWWAALFGYFLIDDALEIHEHGGRFLADWLGIRPALGLRAADFGELGTTAIFATLLLIPLLTTYARGSPEFRRVSARLFVLVAALAACGTALDMVHMLATGRPGLDTALLILEDGGEMAVMSAICAVVAAERAPSRREAADPVPAERRAAAA